jgi:transcriptional regulator with XRE-family HTH domain
MIGTKLREYRIAAGLTQRDVGEILGVTYQQVQKIEKGNDRISIDKLIKLRDMYGVTLDEMVDSKSSLDDTRYKVNLNVIKNLDSLEPNMRNAIIKMINVVAKK